MDTALRHSRYGYWWSSYNDMNELRMNENEKKKIKI
jgi:hypothetical protein